MVSYPGSIGFICLNVDNVNFSGFKGEYWTLSRILGIILRILVSFESFLDGYKNRGPENDAVD